MKNIILFLTLATLFGCQQEIFQPEPATDAPAVFDYVMKTFESLYAPTEERGINWSALRQEYGPMLNEQSNDDELHAVLTDMLANLDDTHVSLTAPSKPLFYANKYYRERLDDSLFRPDIVEKNYLLPGFTKGPEQEAYTYGLMEGEVAYVWFGHVAANWEQFEKAIAKPNIKGLVLDLRHNDGGDFTFALQALEKLNPSRKEVFRSRTKDGDGPDDFTNWQPWYLEGGGAAPDYPIVVLTDRYTVSACERTVMALRQMDNVTIIGDTTNGAISTTVARQLPNGWGYRIATQDVEAPDGTIFEGKGIPPAIFVQNTLADLAAGVDVVLEKALEIIH